MAGEQGFRVPHLNYPAICQRAAEFRRRYEYPDPDHARVRDQQRGGLGATEAGRGLA